MKRIYLSPPHMGELEKQFIQEAFDSNWISPLGPHVDSFEQEMCKKIGVSHGAALSSGTAGIHLSLELLGVGYGDEVICPTLTFAASAYAIVYTGAKPVFIDSNSDTWTIDPQLLEDELDSCAKNGKLPKAVITVDIYGQCADYDAIELICNKYEIPIIEDAAEALGSTYKGRKAGKFGVMSVLSFNGNKIITTSGGGMLLSDKKEYITQARFLATQARDPAPHYEHSVIGYNYRMSNLLAGVGRGQLSVLDDRVKARQSVNERYKTALANEPGIFFMPDASYGKSNCWLTCIIVIPEKFGCTGEDIRLNLEKNNIEARPLWKPMHMQPVFGECRYRGNDVTNCLFQFGLCLPSGSSLSEQDLDRIVHIIKTSK